MLNVYLLFDIYNETPCTTLFMNRMVQHNVHSVT